MFCSNCGSEIEKKYKFCPKCGEKIDINNEEVKPKRGRKKKIVEEITTVELDSEDNSLEVSSNEKLLGILSYLGILSSGARSAAQIESKIIFYLRAPKNIPLPEGAVLTTEDRGFHKTRYWIVMNQEVHPYYGYFKYKLLELDYILKYIGSDGKEHSIPCYINGTGTFDIKEYFKFSNKNIVQKPNRALNTVWATTDNIDKNCKFIIGKETWRYVDEDRISIPGVSYATLNQIGIDEIDDSVSEQLAQKSKLDSIRIVTNYGAGIDEEISINDEFNNLTFYLVKDGKIIKSNFDYKISSNFAIFNEDTNKFELLGDDGSITVTDKITGYS